MSWCNPDKVSSGESDVGKMQGLIVIQPPKLRWEGLIWGGFGSASTCGEMIGIWGGLWELRVLQGTIHRNGGTRSPRPPAGENSRNKTARATVLATRSYRVLRGWCCSLTLFHHAKVVFAHTCFCWFIVSTTQARTRPFGPGFTPGRWQQGSVHRAFQRPNAENGANIWEPGSSHRPGAAGRLRFTFGASARWAPFRLLPAVTRGIFTSLHNFPLSSRRSFCLPLDLYLPNKNNTDLQQKVNVIKEEATSGRRNTWSHKPRFAHWGNCIVELLKIPKRIIIWFYFWFGVRLIFSL